MGEVSFEEQVDRDKLLLSFPSHVKVYKEREAIVDIVQGLYPCNNRIAVFDLIF